MPAWQNKSSSVKPPHQLYSTASLTYKLYNLNSIFQFYLQWQPEIKEIACFNSNKIGCFNSPIKHIKSFVTPSFNSKTLSKNHPKIIYEFKNTIIKTPIQRYEFKMYEEIIFVTHQCASDSCGGGLVAYSESQSSSATNSTEVEPLKKKKKVVVLGTGWASTSFLKDLDISSYDVQVVSPRNYFAFTPLLPSVTCGTVEARSIVEPIRNIIKKKNGEIHFWEAECTKIDAANKKVFCHSVIDSNLVGKNDFSLDYDYLVVAAGAEVNTFNTHGVKEYCHFIKEVEDAQKIRMSVINCLEKSILPELTEEERRINLHFVIVGGGPTGVEFAAELHDFVHEDLVKLYPSVKDMVKITFIQSGDHILNTYDSRISTFAEAKFARDGINVCTGTRVLSVSDKEVNVKIKSTGENVSIPRGMVVWSTGVSTRPVVKDFMDQIGQGKRRVLATDEWLRVKGCEDVYTIGDCATIDQRKVMEDISAIFTAADKDNSGTLSIEEFQDIIDDILMCYPQVELHLRDKHLACVTDLLRDPEGNAREEVDIEGFKSALSQVDSQMKSLPATAQVAAQQGTYLSNCFNKRELAKLAPEGPRRFKGSGRHDFCPFRYKHFGQFAPLGGEQAAAELPGDWVLVGRSTQWLWYSVYARKHMSQRIARASIMEKREEGRNMISQDQRLQRTTRYAGILKFFIC